MMPGMLDLAALETLSPFLCVFLSLVVIGVASWSLPLIATRLEQLPRDQPRPLTGVIADDAREPAAELRLEQTHEQRDGFSRHREVARQFQSRAFTLLVDGARVLVPADDKLRLWWPLDGTEATQPGSRLRWARVTPGARVIVHGVAIAAGGTSQPFREEPRAARRLAPIALVHPSLAVELTQERRRLRRVFGLVTALDAVAVLLLMYGVFGGQPLVGHLRRVEADGTARAHVVVALPSGEERGFGVWSDALGALAAEDQPVALVEGPWPIGVRLGMAPGAPAGAALVGVALAIAALLTTLLRAYRPRLEAWPARHAVDELT